MSDLDNRTEEILCKSRPPADVSPESKARVKNYVYKHLKAMKDGNVSIVSLVTDQFLHELGLSTQHQAFMHRVNDELQRFQEPNSSRED